MELFAKEELSFHGENVANVYQMYMPEHVAII